MGQKLYADMDLNELEVYLTERETDLLRLTKEIEDVRWRIFNKRLYKPGGESPDTREYLTENGKYY